MSRDISNAGLFDYRVCPRPSWLSHWSSPARSRRRTRLGCTGCRRGGVSRLVSRYRSQGEASFTPRSRRPRTLAKALPDSVVEAVLAERDRLTAAGHDAGPETARWHLQHRQVIVSRASIARILTRGGRVVPAPQKRPKSSYIRFQAALPNETWQSDFTHYRLADDAGVRTRWRSSPGGVRWSV